MQLQSSGFSLMSKRSSWSNLVPSMGLTAVRLLLLRFRILKEGRCENTSNEMVVNLTFEVILISSSLVLAIRVSVVKVG